MSPGARLSHADLGLWSDDNAAALEPVFAFCRKYGSAKLGMQLYHGGRKGSITVAWEGQRAIPPNQGGWVPSSASGIPYPGRNEPQALGANGITNVIEDFRDAAKRADALGLDLIEIHAAHGYLLHNFLSPKSNVRSDVYGGSLDGRMRFVLEMFDAIRAVWPDRKAIGVRISATDWVADGWTLDDSVTLSRTLREHGCDYITASSGGAVPEQELKVFPGYQVPFAERIRREADIPTMAVGLITEPAQAEEILASGQADLVALGRGMLFNPRWPWHAAIELEATVAYPPQYDRSHPKMRGGDFLKPKAE